MAEIKPALTAGYRAEWAAWLAQSPERRKEVLGWARDEVDVDGYTDVRLLAAKALHNQPFGFTWEDVDVLRDVTKALRRADIEAGLHHGDHLLALVEDVAGRIEALLPPAEEA
jgi:hypothetical protein